MILKIQFKKDDMIVSKIPVLTPMISMRSMIFLTTLMEAKLTRRKMETEKKMFLSFFKEVSRR